MNPILATSGAAVAAWAAAAAFAYAMAGRALDPGGGTADPRPELPGAEVRPVAFTSAAGTLAGVTVSPAGPVRGTVVLAHGWGRSANQMLAWSAFLAEAGWASVAFDFRGHGASPPSSRVVLSGLANDVAAAEAFLAGRPEFPRPHIGAGLSMGAAATLLASLSGARFDAIVLAASFAELNEPARLLLRRLRLPAALFLPVVRLAWERAGWRQLRDIDPVRRIGEVAVPVLIVQGDRDRVIPPSDAARLAAAAPAQRVRRVEVQGGGHSDLERFPAFREAMLTFLSASSDLSPITG